MCDSSPARLFVVRRTMGSVSRVVVCAECAKNNVAARGNAREAREMLRTLRSVPEVDLLGVERCGLCGATASEIASDGKPGCCLCYSRFPDECEEFVRMMQGGLFHIGKNPVL
jgi:protein-arginine kinase activator protein McsA